MNINMYVMNNKLIYSILDVILWQNIFIKSFHPGNLIYGHCIITIQALETILPN